MLGEREELHDVIVLREDNGQYCKYCNHERSHLSFIHNLIGSAVHLASCVDVAMGLDCRCEPCSFCRHEVCSNCQELVLITPFGTAVAGKMSPALKYRLGENGELEVVHLCRLKPNLDRVW
jgi:hypothetical protein